MRLALALLFGALLSAGAQAEIHKCRMPDGSLAFLDHPCPENAKALEAPKVPSATPFAWRCGKDEPAPIQNKDELAGLTPAQREAWAAAAYGIALARKESRVFLDRGGSVHVCSESGSRAPLEVVFTPDGRVWSKRDDNVKRIGGPDRGTRLGECSRRITDCDQGTSGSLDQCANEVPICATNEPVEGESCCAAACIDRYRELRAQDVDSMTAIQRALFENEACSGMKPRPG